MKKLATILVLFIAGAFITEARAQKLAVKSNLLYDATTTVNLGVEIGLAKRWTLELPVNYNPWKYGNEMRIRHFGVQPEVRYWFCEKFNRSFIGLHGHYAIFNVGNWPDRSIFSGNMQRSRYEGYLYGAGVSIGRSWILKKRWSLEASVGVGYARIVTDKYPCGECGTKIKKDNKNYFGPTKASITLVYMLK